MSIRTTRLALAAGLTLLSSSVLAIPLVNGLGGDAGFGENSLSRNDDGSRFIDLSGVFDAPLNFYGTEFDSLYLNNNGNVTINRSQSTYTPVVLTGNTDNPIIAPFFADVDTRGGPATPTPGGNSTGSNRVFYDLDEVNGVFTATWDDVGFYSRDNSLLNAFQLSLSDRGNGDFDIEFRYEVINWTTGDASGGSDGLGGRPARAGYSSGNGTDFFEIAVSGDQDGVLDLENLTNISPDGRFLFTVTDGAVVANPPSDVPEPGTLFLLAGGLLAAGSLKRLRKV